MVAYSGKSPHQTVSTSAHFPCCSAALEAASCRLVEVCLANPQHFYVTEVLGPACMGMAKAEPSVYALTRECA